MNLREAWELEPAELLEMLPELLWRDLARLGASVRTPPRVRQSADRLLVLRLPRLTVGEKISLGRIAGAGVLPHLLRDGHPQVVAATLRNPRLTEAAVLLLARSPTSPPKVLEKLARDPRWGVAYGVRHNLAENPSTPRTVALSILPTLRKVDQRAVARSVRAPMEVRRRAGLLSGAGMPSGRGPGGRLREAD